MSALPARVTASAPAELAVVSTAWERHDDPTVEDNPLDDDDADDFEDEDDLDDDGLFDSGASRILYAEGWI